MNRLYHRQTLLVLLVLLASVLAVGRVVAWPAVVFGAPPEDDPIGQTRAAMRFVLPADMAELPAGAIPRARGQDGAAGPFQRVSDDSDAISAEIPTAWQDIESRHWTSGSLGHGLAVAASTNLEGFDAGAEPGIVIAATHDEFDPSAVGGFLDNETQQYTAGCKQDRRADFATAFYVGKIAYAFNCGGGSRNVLIIAATPPAGGHLIVVRLSVFGQGDLKAVAHILDTVQVLGDPGHDDHDH